MLPFEQKLRTRKPSPKILSWAFSFALFHYFVSPLSSLANSDKTSEYQPPFEPKSWVSLSFQKIPANEIVFSKNEISVKVNSSAGPLVHSLPEKKLVSRIQARGFLVGDKKQEAGDFDEDSIFRLGLVTPGKHTLTGPKRWFAAPWLKTLFSLAPEGTGIDSVQFLFVSNRETLDGKTRIHPLSKFLHEQVSSVLKMDKTFKVEKSFEPPLEVLALWVSIDGDDSKSAFETKIEEIRLTHSP